MNIFEDWFKAVETEIIFTLHRSRRRDRDRDGRRRDERRSSHDRDRNRRRDRDRDRDRDRGRDRRDRERSSHRSSDDDRVKIINLLGWNVNSLLMNSTYFGFCKSEYEFSN